MRRLPIQLALTLAATVPVAWGNPAAAVPTLDLSWDNCAPIQSTKIPGPNETVLGLYCTATGVDVPHLGYEINLWFAAELPCSGVSTSTPDAWRFDAAGCQGGFATVVFANPQQSCPPLWGTTPPLTQATLEYAPADGVTPPGAMRLRVVVAYPSAQPANPARQHAFAVRFDHEFSTAGPGDAALCGGYERPMCFALWRGAGSAPGECGAPLHLQSKLLRAPDGQEVPFAVGHGAASFGLDPQAAFGCFRVVPARAATWGAIKGQYR